MINILSSEQSIKLALLRFELVTQGTDFCERGPHPLDQLPPVLWRDDLCHLFIYQAWKIMVCQNGK